MKNHDHCHTYVEPIQESADLASFPTKASLDISNSHSNKAQHALCLFESLRKTVDTTSSVLSSTHGDSSSPTISPSNLHLNKSIDIDNRVKKVTSPREAADLTSKGLQSRLMTAEATIKILYRQNQELRDRLTHVMGKMKSARNLPLQDVLISNESKASTLLISRTENSVIDFCLNGQDRYEDTEKGEAFSLQLGDRTGTAPGQFFGSTPELRGRIASSAQLAPFSDLPRTMQALSPLMSQGSIPSVINDSTTELVNSKVERQLAALRQQLIEQQVQHDVELLHMNEQLYLMERKRELRYI
ncbi:unnamed protein product [Phytomonas sp. Hart1]|nr:unnamed protein product [Phytomonas sp. Hart1]|eukprot:CCW66381.1 unnamed protein product [Phytomonas sp. isolate Hart1]